MACCAAALPHSVRYFLAVCLRCAPASPLALLHAAREAADAQCPAGTHRTWATPTEVGAKAEAAATRAAATAVFMYMMVAMSLDCFSPVEMDRNSSQAHR
jgi:hypothetical protein